MRDSSLSDSGGCETDVHGLAVLLRNAQEMLSPLRKRLPAAARALDLLERDLLPRTAGGDAYLVCGIVGPNNAGKSALFNALLGRVVSPSVPAGGATRRLVGAASPQLIEQLEADPALRRFALRTVPAATGRVDDALQPAQNPAELLAVAEPGLPPNIMLIDTPDFDSILADNRLASESLLAVADVVVAVVTRHSYQNREVVRFLERWLDHGRPWMLFYNEAIDEQVARAHAGKLTSQVGEKPLAVFWAPHSLAVQDGSALLVARRLLMAEESVDFLRGGFSRRRKDGGSAAQAEEFTRRGAEAAGSPLQNGLLMLRHAQHERESGCGTRLSAHPEPVEGRAVSGPMLPEPEHDCGDLRSVLFDLEQAAEVKARAFAAALARLDGELETVVAALESESAEAAEILAVVDRRAAETGRAVAAAAMPGGPFVDAFRTVLDRRTNMISRSWRRLLRGVRLQIERAVTALRGRSLPEGNAALLGSLAQIEAEALRQAWPGLWESLARDLGPEARHAARKRCRDEIAHLLDADLDERRRGPALEEAASTLSRESVDLDAFGRACEDLIEHAIDQRGFDADIQALADLATVAPLALAAGIVVKTGGLGMDLAVAGGGAVSSFLVEKYSHLLGSGILSSARRRWSELRGGQIGSAIIRLVLHASGSPLRESAEQAGRIGGEIASLRVGLARAAEVGNADSGERS